MTTVLRPLSIGQILDRAIQLYRKQFWTYWSVFAVVQIPISILSLIVTYYAFSDVMTLITNPFDLTTTTTTNSFGFNIANSLNTLLGLFAIQFASAMCVVIVAEAHFGRTLHFRDALGVLRERWQSIAGVALLTAGILLGISILTLLAILTLIGGVAGLGVIMFFSFVITPLVMPILMLENASAWKVFGRAYQLAKKRFWRLLGAMSVLTLLVAGLQIGLQATMGGIIGLIIGSGDAMSDIEGAADTFSTLFIVTTAVSSILSLFTAPLSTIAATLIYMDLRVRFEGLDLMAQATDETGAALLAMAPQEPPDGEKLLTWQSFWRFFGLGGAVIGVYLILVALIAALVLSFSL